MSNSASANQFIIMHIPKCAGTSLRLGLEVRFGASSIVELYSKRDQFGRPSQPIEAYTAEFVIGHFGVSYFQNSEHDRKVITFLRNPIDRILSHYYYWHSSKNRSIGAKLAQQLSLSDFLRSDLVGVRRQISNMQTWMLAANIDMNMRHRYACIPQDELVDMAKNSIGQFDFVGLTRNFGRDIEFLNDQYNWGVDGAWPIENVTKERKSVSEMDEETMELLRGLTSMDRQLYDFVKTEIYEKQFSASHSGR